MLAMLINIGKSFDSKIPQATVEHFEGLVSVFPGRSIQGHRWLLTWFGVNNLDNFEFLVFSFYSWDKMVSWWNNLGWIQGGWPRVKLVFSLGQPNLTVIGKSWKTHPEIFLKFPFSRSSHRLYWKTHPLKITYSVFSNSEPSYRPIYWKTHPFDFFDWNHTWCM